MTRAIAGFKRNYFICLLLVLLGVNFSIVSADLPATTNYKLNSFGFGSGGGANSTTSTYALEGIGGEVSGQTAVTNTYSGKPGYIQTQQSNVPTITLSNPSSYYDKLKFVIGTQGNPTDAKYALQVSTTSDFSSNIKYVKSDLTISATLTTADYKIYTAWGGASGNNMIGLSPSTTYYIRAKATHLTSFNGISTESAYGPSSSAATVGTQLSFCIYTNANCGAGGNTEAFGNLLAGSVTNSPTNIGVDFATNADAGGQVYISSANSGLSSAQASYSISSATADLSSASQGYGAQVASVTQSSGGPLNKISPFNGSANNVGLINTTSSSILSSTSPITGGSGAIQLQAKSSNITPAATDYQDTITLIAAAAF